MRHFLFIFCYSFSITCQAFEEVYQTPDDFIKESFSTPVQAQTLWITGDLKNRVKAILGNNYHKLRIRYWQQENRTAWILERIGKEHYITSGFVINDHAIERAKVLIFRESRGWEVKHDFFSRQFTDAKLKNNSKLDTHIDNITGATLSVRAVKKKAALALLLHQVVTEKLKNE